MPYGNSIFTYVDVDVRESDEGVTIEGDGEDFLGLDKVRELIGALCETLPRAEQPSIPLASQVSFNEVLFRAAAAHGKTVVFRYEKSKYEPPQERRLVPESVQKVGDHLTFVGYDPDRDAPRAYRLDRVRGQVTVDA